MRAVGIRELIWLAAHPKSGSTWLRFMLYHLCFGRAQSSADVDHRMGSLHGDRPAALVQADGGVILTHKARGAHAERFDANGRFILLVRHPADALVSQVRHFVLEHLHQLVPGRPDGKARDEDVAQLSSVYLTRYVETGAHAHPLGLGFGTWGEHSVSWLAARGDRLGLVVRYEDLLTDAPTQLTRITAHLGLHTTPGCVQQAVNDCNIAQMRILQANEIRERHPGRFYQSRQVAAQALGIHFIGRGRQGDGARLPALVMERLLSDGAEGMAALGYGVVGHRPTVLPVPSHLI